MKVRYAMIAAALAAGTCLAVPGAALAQAEDTAASDAKWDCVIDNKCDGGESAVGEGIAGPDVRPVIDDDRAQRVPRSVVPAATGAKAPVMAQKAGLRGSGVKQMSTGRRGAAPTQTQADAKAYSAPSAVANGADLFVTFRRNSAVLESGVTADMRSLAKKLNESIAAGNKRVIQIGGHTDATGDDAFNLKLSEERAEAVRKSLLELGVPADAIQAVGYGETKPIDGYDPTHGVNRRVEVVLLK